MENKLTTQALLYKISEVRNFSLGVALSTSIPIILIISLDINIIFVGILIYLFILYTVCFFITSNVLDKYRNTANDTYMTKETFSTFFKKSNQLKLFLLSLLLITIGIWVHFTLDSILLNLDLNLIVIMFLISFSVYCIYAVKKLLDLFVITYVFIKIIKYINKESVDT